MANEKRDELFSINLGEELIEVPEKNEAPAAGKGEARKAANKEPEKTDEGIIINEDGTFEISEIKQIEDEDEASDREGATIIEKSEAKKGKTPSEGSSSDSSPSSSPYLAFAKDRAEEGVFLDFTDEDWKELVERNDGDEAEALRELHRLSMSEMIRTEVERFKESLTPEEKALYEAKEKGLPVDKYSVAKRNYDKYSRITPEKLKENVSLQEEVVTRFLELRGYSPEEIQEEIDGYKALDNLDTKALKALEFVPKAFEKQVRDIEKEAEAEEQAKKDKIRQRVVKMKSLIENTPEIIPGIKLTKPAREKIMESMTIPVAQDKEGNPLNAVMATRAKNPEAFEIMIHYYHQLGLFNIDDNGKISPDFSKIAKIEKTKVVDSIRSVFESKENMIMGKPVKPKTSDDEMSDFEKAFGRL